jgi:hypothetical protein
MISHLLDPKTLALLKTLADAEKAKPESPKPASATPAPLSQTPAMAPSPMLPQMEGGKKPITPDEIGGLLAFAHANNPLPWVPQQSTEAPADGPNLSKGTMQPLATGFMGQFMNNAPAPQPQPGMLGMRGMLGAGPAAAMQHLTGTPEAMDSLGMARMNQKPKPGMNTEAGWLMIALAGLAQAGGATPQQIQGALNNVGSGIQQRMQRESDVQQQQAKFAFNRAEQMRDREDKSAAAQAKGAALMLDAAQAKNPQEAQILLAEAQRVMGKAPTAGQALGIMDRAQKSEQAANDIIEFNRSVKEAQMANTKADNERQAQTAKFNQANTAFTKWYAPIKNLARPPSAEDLPRLKAEYDGIARQAADAGATIPSFEEVIATNLAQYRSITGDSHWKQTFDQRAAKYAADGKWREYKETIRQRELKARLEESKAKASAKIATGVGKDDPDVKETLRQVNYTIDGKLKDLRKLGNPNAIADPTQKAQAIQDYADISQEARDEYNWAALNYGDDHALVKAMRAKLKGMHIEVSPNVRESSRIAASYGGLYSIPDIPGVTSPKAQAPNSGAFQGPFAPPVDPAPGVKPIRRTVPVGKAIVKLDVPYKWGGTDPNTGVDCSGLTQCIYKQNGVSIPRTAIQQWRSPKMVAVKDYKPGDLVFFQSSANHTKDRYDKNAGGYVTHVAIIGNDGRIVQAVKGGTKTESLEAYLKRSGSKLLGVKRYQA